MSSHPAGYVKRSVSGWSAVARSLDRARRLLHANWVLALVLLVFFAVSIWIGVLTPVATTDDWSYTRSVEILLQNRHLEVFPVVAATAVFQILWGSLFALFFDNTLGAVRISTLVMVGLSGIALYDICRRLRVSPERSALAVAAYLFDPLSFVLSYSFMTDPHFASVTVITTALTLRSIESEQSLSTRWLIAGSITSAAAILIRQEGVLTPLAIAFFFFLRGDIPISRQGFRRLLEIGFIPALTLLGYLVWLRLFNGVPYVQQAFAAEITDAGIQGSLRLISSLSFFEIMYIGFFLLPITTASLAGGAALIRGMRCSGWIIATVWILAAFAGVVFFSHTKRRMPYISQFMGAGGLGPADVRGSRPALFEQPMFDVLTAICLISTIVAVLFIARNLSARFAELRNGAGLIGVVLVFQVAGAIPPSYHYIHRGYSLDRYLLPLLPLVLVLAIWSLNDINIALPVGWAVILVFGVFAVLGTRDYLRYLDAVWDVAAYATEAGARPEQIEAGAAWDGYHLYTYGVDQGIDRARTRDGPWWTYFFGKASTSTYVVAGEPLEGYDVVATFPYSSTLQSKPTILYLLRLPAAPWPPVPSNGG